MDNRIIEIRSRLEAISEDLADVALDVLKEALSEGAETTSIERRITRARRSVEKAVFLLSPMDQVENDF